METSRSEDAAAPLHVDPEPAPAEAAAIAAAVQAYLRDEADAESEECADREWWREHSWRLYGRFRELHGDVHRPTGGLPRDPWRAANRIRRP